ncbi:family 1 glycosylhydrolase [Caulobacter sp. S45]|uniref:family 1 glycosylhydrolase n=1 Tax=Caulobacter sp. S45 TaxID=1641861 RepID=UPI00131C64F9|nr:family 1 glycosylhydrolase [Caulobacter sp. S45]
MLELWGGHECTVNRVGDEYRDQSKETGHDERALEDLGRFAGLNVKSLRYPVLWERVAPDAPDTRDWSRADTCLAEIRRLGMQPIVGLLHHGSGPRYTSLLSDNFVSSFGEYAHSVAARYPWVRDWTPINEPLTTARFSALYGHWYPHACDEGLFWRALLNQIDGVRVAMRAIRDVNPEARLIQTEDLGQVFSTPGLAADAEFQNVRRWATWDLLTGSIGPDHPLFERIAGFGLADRLKAIADDPCPPDIIGVNHYPTSVRFLDERVENYPEWDIPSGAHADVDAVRILSPQPVDLKSLLRQAWDRYAIPLAITESHNGCTRDEQMRWTFEAWRTALDLRDAGVDVRAVTAWALLGNYDWDSLITRKAGSYEPGTFDIRGPSVRATAMADMLRRLGLGDSPEAVARAHPVLLNRGWWRRDLRLERPPYSCDPVLAHAPDHDLLQEPPLLITGATGALGQAIAGACRLRGVPHRLTSRQEIDLAASDGFATILDGLEPWAVINAAGWTGVDEAERRPDDCDVVNVRGAAALAKACVERGLPCVNFSSDLVFGDRREGAYTESDSPSPLGAYGRSKAEAERLIAAVGASNLVVRIGPLFSPYDAQNFAAQVARGLAAGQPVYASATHIMTPTYTPDLAQAVLDLLIDGETGVRHLSSGEALSWYDFAVRIGSALGQDISLVSRASPEMLGWRAERPTDSALATERGFIMPSFEGALGRFARTLRPALSALQAAA